MSPPPPLSTFGPPRPTSPGSMTRSSPSGRSAPTWDAGCRGAKALASSSAPATGRISTGPASTAPDRGPGGLAPALGARDFLAAADDAQISALVTHGVPGTEMVAYGLDFGGPLTSTQIRAVSSYLRSLEEDAAGHPSGRTPLADSNLSGRDLFNMACRRCHGTHLPGGE